LDVDSFIGVKSHRAKGKRITTYDVATLHFVEPELPAEPELTEPDDEEPETVDVDLDQVADAEVDIDVEVDDVTIEPEPAVVSEEPEKEVYGSGIVIDSEQLNLF
jgi:topoisomerase-4 subunit A